MTRASPIDPYRVLFPIGLAYGLWGSLVWAAYGAGLGTYPGQLHASVMIGGFLFSFAAGFLLTAVPKFTGAPAASSSELAIGIGLSLGPLLASTVPGIAAQSVAQSIANLVMLLFLAAFFGTRARKRAFDLPPHFLFIPLGLAFGIVGSTLIATSAAPLAGRVLLYQGTLLCFTLGIGGKLVTALLGWAGPPLARVAPLGSLPRKEPGLFGRAATWQALLVLLSFALETGLVLQEARLLRAAAALWIGFGSWKLHRKSPVRSRLANWLRVSGICLVAGVSLHALFPSSGVHGLHLLFASGFGLMTLMIASRVTLAHGGYGMRLELDSRALRWASGLAVFAAITRATAPLTPSYESHLAYAGLTWALALGIWGATFVPRMIKRSSE